ncbi:hypothetical protein GCM10008938_26730 [Deinococcus roseus]|uniref:PELOTA RNA-binding domain-containing protein n=2 Tax=Deinococcus roseus TaxID=392414 RepID=A0ABQ2D0N3_9DEIO|nr:hypothetical protein GCM10008938_26730 [Deinococcus roseus]
MPTSYDPQDVTFLLLPIEIETLSVEEKEKRIQSGNSHYSEILSIESPPKADYLELYHRAVERQAARVAQDIRLLAAQLVQDTPAGQKLVLVSLARAGTPVGVLLTRFLRSCGHEVQHYSVSIIRDRGLDLHALQHIVNQEGNLAEHLHFIDGWTGKGVISRELQISVDHFNAEQGTRLSSNLYVLADISGTAHHAPTHEDYLIPHAVLNGTVSGLISRTVRQPEAYAAGAFDGAMHLEHLTAQDETLTYLGMIEEHHPQPPQLPELLSDSPRNTAQLRTTSMQCLQDLQRGYGERPLNYIKPGVGESTRVMLRRIPERLIVRDPQHPDVHHLIELAEKRQVEVTKQVDLPYQAVALIRPLLTDQDI